MTLLTVGKLARKFGLSRSTLLYYDSIGLLSPVGHHQGEYRMYGAAEEGRLAQICRYRRAGIPLQQIKKILDAPETSLKAVLEQRFADLNVEIGEALGQQRIIAGILQNPQILRQSGVMTKELWVSLLEASGFSEEDMHRWHTRFERNDPEKHRLFLQHLQISAEEIEVVRQWAIAPQKIAAV
jgi:DNA-binding transcriptional MerR regulator